MKYTVQEYTKVSIVSQFTGLKNEALPIYISTNLMNLFKDILYCVQNHIKKKKEPSRFDSIILLQTYQVVQFSCILYRNYLEIQEYKLYPKNTSFDLLENNFKSIRNVIEQL